MRLWSFKCPHCAETYDSALTSTCPYCGKPSASPDCPDPLCILDMVYPQPCFGNCPQVKKARAKKPGWGGKRPGAGAPKGNLNGLKHGKDSKLLKRAVERLADDPELRAFLLLIARAATDGEIPETTKRLISRALDGTKRQAAAITLRGLRNEP